MVSNGSQSLLKRPPAKRCDHRLPWRLALWAALGFAAWCVGCRSRNYDCGADAAPNPGALASAAPASAESGMPLRPVHIELRDATLHAYEVDDDALLQLVSLASIGALPVERAGQGWRIGAAPAGSLLALAGLEPGDMVKDINGAEPSALTRPLDLAAAYDRMRERRRLIVTVDRAGAIATFTYVVRPTRLRWPAGEPEMPAAAGDAEPEGSSGPLADGDAGVPCLAPGGVTRLSDTSYTVRRSWVDALLAAQAELLRSVRAVPVFEKGQAVGLQLYGIRSTSPLGQLGLRNADLVVAVNGLPLARPDTALEAYSRLRHADRVVVDLKREEQPLTLTYRMVP